MINKDKKALIAISLVAVMVMAGCAGIVYAMPEAAAKQIIPKPPIQQTVKIDTCAGSQSTSGNGLVNYAETEKIWDSREQGSDGSVRWTNMGNGDFTINWQAPQWNYQTSEQMWLSDPNAIYNSHRYANVGYNWAPKANTCGSNDNQMQVSATVAWDITVAGTSTTTQWTGDSVSEVDVYGKWFENTYPSENNWLGQPVLEQHWDVAGSAINGFTAGGTFVTTLTTDQYTNTIMRVNNIGTPIFFQFYVDAYHNNQPVQVTAHWHISDVQFRVLSP